MFEFIRIQYRLGKLTANQVRAFAHRWLTVEQREQAYNTDPCVAWDGDMLTVTEAAQQWSYYAAEGNAAKMDALTALIAAAKAEIRAKYPDNAGGT